MRSFLKVKKNFQNSFFGPVNMPKCAFPKLRNIVTLLGCVDFYPIECVTHCNDALMLRNLVFVHFTIHRWICFIFCVCIGNGSKFDNYVFHGCNNTKVLKVAKIIFRIRTGPNQRTEPNQPEPGNRTGNQGTGPNQGTERPYLIIVQTRIVIFLSVNGLF